MSRAAVHPFPARMAPDFTAEAVASLAAHSVVLDPMMGSGSFPVAAALAGMSAIGFDTDPLAVIIAKTSAGAFDRGEYLASAARVVKAASTAEAKVHADAETAAFVSYWFDSVAQDRLGRLATAIGREALELQPMLWCAFSRLIITKETGASLARDVSHSRPHRTRKVTPFDPVARFGGAANAIVDRLPPRPSIGVPPRLEFGDARSMPLADRSVDAILTSPPYLSAIDYLRGHRLSLVWMGHTIQALRTLRGENIGTERGTAVRNELVAHLDSVSATQGVEAGCEVCGRREPGTFRVFSGHPHARSPYHGGRHCHGLWFHRCRSRTHYLSRGKSRVCAQASSTAAAGNRSAIPTSS